MATRSSLIIEDDPDASFILASLVADRGFETVQSYTGEEGLRLAREIEPDIIFLDLMLPDLDGYKICEALKLDRETNPIPVVMVTALSAPRDRVEGFRVGADAYVSKPYTPEDIDQAVAQVFALQDRIASDKVELHLRFDLASEADNLQSVNELFGIVLRHTKLSDREIHQLRMAFLELGQNAIEWGNRLDKSKTVKITVHICSDRVEIEICDEGPGFDPRNLPHASNGGDDPTIHFSVRQMLGLRDGGFGILIAKGLVDEVRYNERGNAVTLIKRISS